VVFTDATLVVQSTRIKAVHLTQLRTAVDAVRVLAGLGGYGYSDPTITALSTPVRRAHIIDLLAAKRNYVQGYELHPRGAVFRLDYAWLGEGAPRRG